MCYCSISVHGCLCVVLMDRMESVYSVLPFILMLFIFAFRDGIKFAFRVPEDGSKQLPNADFLEILSEFSFKLLQQDRVVM